tara:strand:- start:19 stop:336 length:318 start_codon:yes stop_codon:yes gene_type:complete
MSEKIYKNVNGVKVEMQGEELAYFKKLRDDFENAPKKTSFDYSLENLRITRNNLLKESDWTVLPDSPIADKTAWQTYRTELRNLTNGLTTVEDVEDVTWPTKPGA